jgi:hypothetical protein
MNPLTFPYQYRGVSRDPQTLAPLLPLTLSRGGVSVDVVGLVDSGAMYSILPFDLGARFGVPWNSLAVDILLGRIAAGITAKLLMVEGRIGTHPPTPLVFAWSPTNTVPILLGQVNCFFEFDICFYRSRSEFTVAPRTP